jgi:transposase
VNDRFDAVISNLNEQLAALDQEITAVLHTGAWAAPATLLLSIPGIGIHTAAWLLVSTFNFTLCETPEALVSYTGLSPLERESGTSIHRRPHVGRGGNARLRTTMYMAALSACRWDPTMQSFYTRLREWGKVSKVARCAVARNCST